MRGAEWFCRFKFKQNIEILIVMGAQKLNIEISADNVIPFEKIDSNQTVSKT